MAVEYNLEPLLLFLDELRLNNHKTWFDQHRSDYESARNTFEQFVGELIDEFRVPDHLQGLTARNCIARIYRDIRFSKDKSPYKTNMGAMVAPGGWRTTAFGYYISLEPRGRSMVAGGLYNPTPEQLRLFRQAIDEDATRFKAITARTEFVEAFGEVSGDRLKTAPKGYDPAHPDIGLLQLKQITAIRRFSDQEVLADDFLPQAVKTCHAMRLFLDCLSDIMK